MRKKINRSNWTWSASLVVGGVAATWVLASVISAKSDTPPAPKPSGAISSSAAALTAASSPTARQALMKQYCSGCHNDRSKAGSMSIEHLNSADVSTSLDAWEKILRRVSLGEMPPSGARRPAPDEVLAFAHGLENDLDKHGAANPDPGRTVIRRLNRAEYANAVRDLLDVKFGTADELPADDSGYGFDNIAAILSISPTLMDRYIAVAGKVARQAVGTISKTESTAEYMPPKDLNVLYHGVPSYNVRASDNLPLLSRGGADFQYEAPYDGNYVIEVVLNSNTIYDNNIEKQNTYEVRVRLTAGSHRVGVSFPQKLGLREVAQRAYSGFNVPGGEAGVVEPKGFGAPPALDLNIHIDGKRINTLKVPAWAEGPQFFQANFDRDVIKMSVRGPYDITGQVATLSQQKIFVCRPKGAADETRCARLILSRVAEKAYRRAATGKEIAALMKVYSTARADGKFENGIEVGIQAILVSPQFLFMREALPAKAVPGGIYKITDAELAGRLSLFLWSSVPDDQLMSLARQNKLRDPKVLKAQVRRMLADRRAEALTENFAGQWLYLRALDYQRPDIAEFKNFDERLRAAMKTETKMFFTSVLHDNRSVLDLIDSDYSFLNQRLAEHYGIPGIYGEAFRKVKLDPAWQRGGLLGQGSILTVTSFNNRTSIVRRGKWILENILVAPPPAPPPNVPAFSENGPNSKFMTVRQTMELHRNNPICASCHTKIDPLGFALENYDAVGAWRTQDHGAALDVSATMPDGEKFTGAKGLKTLLINRKEHFIDGFVERLMTYALARGIEARDMPTVRQVRRRAAADQFRMDSVILGIVESPTFQTRKMPLLSASNNAQKNQKVGGQ